MDCVIFDFDGTIANTVPLCVEALRRAVQNLTGRKPTAEEVKSTFGPSEEGTLAAFAPGRADEGMEIYLGIYRELHPVLCPAPFGGLEQVFSFLREKGVKTALVTGKSAPSLAIDLELFGMRDLFCHIETGNPARADKPVCIARTLSRLGVLPRNALYVGDTVSDIFSARESGMRIASAAWAPAANAEELARHRPDHLFTSVGAFAAWLKQTI